MSMIHIGLAGLPFSGKSEVARYLEGSYQAFVYSAGRELFGSILTKLGLPLTRANHSMLSTAMRAELGEKVVVDAYFQRLPRDPPGICVADGLRWAEAVHEHQRHPPFFLLYLKAPVEVRFDRNRGKPKLGRPAVESLSEFIFEDNLESESEVPELEKLADKVIDTSGSLEKTIDEVEETLLKWLAQSNLGR